MATMCAAVMLYADHYGSSTEPTSTPPMLSWLETAS